MNRRAHPVDHFSTKPRETPGHQRAAAIGLIAYADMQTLDLAGPLDVFGAANARCGDSPPYRLCIIGLTADVVRAENGLPIVPTHTLADAPPLDTLLIPGGAGSRVLDSDLNLLSWLRDRAETTRRMVSVCTGAFILAAAGLLDGRRVTTHWRFANDLARRYPRLLVEPEQLFLRDGRFISSGGLTAGMDLALALVEEDLGASTALAVARELVMYVKRPGNQAQFSAPLAAQTRGNGRLDALLDWVLAHLADNLTVAGMAAQAAMSERQLRRRCAESFGIGPARLVEQLRLERACILLTQSNVPIKRIAADIGFPRADTFRRAFHERYGASPGEYRERFG